MESTKKDGLIIAPNFVYSPIASSSNNLKFLRKIKLIEYNKFTEKEYINFIKDKGFFVIKSKTVKSKVNDECIFIGKNLNSKIMLNIEKL